MSTTKLLETNMNGAGENGRASIAQAIAPAKKSGALASMFRPAGVARRRPTDERRRSRTEWRFRYGPPRRAARRFRQRKPS
jgi:hypothetical protein